MIIDSIASEDSEFFEVFQFWNRTLFPRRSLSESAKQPRYSSFSTWLGKQLYLWSASKIQFHLTIKRQLSESNIRASVVFSALTNCCRTLSRSCWLSLQMQVYALSISLIVMTLLFSFKIIVITRSLISSRFSHQVCICRNSSTGGEILIGELISFPHAFFRKR